MAYSSFLNYRTYVVGDVVAYNGGVYVFISTHTPGDWDASQVVQINQTATYGTADFNTLPNYNLSSPLGAPQYRVNYFINNDELVAFDGFPVDTQTYLEGASVVLQGYAYTRFSANGLWAYEFAGWSLNKGMLENYVHEAGDIYVMANHDLNLYAVWTKKATIMVDEADRLMMITEYRDAIPSLYIPEYFGGSRIKTIAAGAFANSSIDEIIIPPNITQIEALAFENWTGTTLRFVDAEVTTKYPALQLNANCFSNTPNLLSIILPYRWRAATGVLFPAESNKAGVLKIYIRNSKSFMNDELNVADAEIYIASNADPGLNYDRVIKWGYND